MLWRLALLLTIVPALELALLLEVHRAAANAWGVGVGLLVTVGSLVASGVVGAGLVRWQGLGVIRAIGAALERGEFPASHLVDGAMILAGGVLLLAPGYLTDAVGFSLLIPGTRRLYRGMILLWLRRKLQGGEVLLRPPIHRFGPDVPFAPGGGPVIDVTPEDGESGS